ncbi:TetR/AcrR family transcriptional regulator [Pseudomonas wadenswilerensis]
MPAAATTPRCARPILDAARDLLAEVGYGAMSMRQLASRAGLLPGSLYHHVASKEDLLLCVLLDLHQQRDAAWKARSRSASKNGKLAAFITFVLDWQAAHPAETLVLDHEYRHLPDKLQHWLEQRGHGLCGQLQRLLERNGLPRADAWSGAVAIMALLAGANTLRQDAASWPPSRLKAHFHQLASRLLDASLSSSTSPRSLSN